MFEWDAANEAEVTGHGVLPTEAEEVFADPARRRAPGYERGGEARWRLAGQTSAGRLLGVVYTWRGSAIRIITAYSLRGRRRREYLEGRERGNN